MQLKHALRDDNAKHARTVNEVVKFEQAAITASPDLKLVRAKVSAAKRSCDNYSLTRQTLRFILARWGAEPWWFHPHLARINRSVR